MLILSIADFNYFSCYVRQLFRSRPFRETNNKKLAAYDAVKRFLAKPELEITYKSSLSVTRGF